MSTRYPDTPHNDFIETIVDLGLAEHNDITNTLCFFEEDKKYDLITATIDAFVKAPQNLSEINSKGKMQWIFQTFADVFCYGKFEETQLTRLVDLYEKWLDVNEEKKPKYIIDNYVECAKIMIGQMTIPFGNVKKREKIENHASYCLNVVKIFNTLVCGKHGNELNEWILTCLYGIFTPVFGLFHDSKQFGSKQTKQGQFKFYVFLIKRMINLMHLCLLKSGNVSNKLWEVFISNAGEWQIETEVIQQWNATTLALQESYIKWIIDGKKTKPVITFMTNNGSSQKIEMDPKVLQTMWINFCKLSHVDFKKLTDENALILEEGVSILMNDLLSQMEDHNLHNLVDGNGILDLFGETITAPIFCCDHEAFQDTICSSIANTLYFFTQTLPTTDFSQEYNSLLINVIQSALSSQVFLVNKSCLDNVQYLLNYPLIGITLSIELIYQSIESILNTSKRNEKMMVGETTAIYFTSSFQNATLKVNGSPAANGVRKRVSLSGETTQVILELKPVSENSLWANTYTINVVKFDGIKAKLSDDKHQLQVQPLGVSEGSKILVAFYQNGKFQQVQPATYEGEALFFPVNQAYTDIKIMAWQNFDTLKSLCVPEELSIQ